MNDGVGFVDPIRLDLDSRHSEALMARPSRVGNPEAVAGNLGPKATKPDPSSLIRRRAWIQYLGRWEQIQLEEIECSFLATDHGVACSVESFGKHPFDVPIRRVVIEHDGGGC